MNFKLVFNFLIDFFQKEKIDYALIGGFALQASGITRATQDIDFLILSKDASKVKDFLIKKDYKIIYESEDVLNCAGSKQDLGRIDFLLSHRKYSLAMLKNAQEKMLNQLRLKIKVIKTEDLIGLKVQAISNDPERFHKDMADIRLLIKGHYSALNKDVLREYFKLFEREKEIEEILQELKNAQ